MTSPEANRSRRIMPSTRARLSRPDLARLAAIEIKGLSMQQCLPLAYDIQLPQNTVIP
jgi:hypothetical protein